MKSGLSGSNSSGDQTTLAAARRINNFFSPQLPFSLFKNISQLPKFASPPKNPTSFSVPMAKRRDRRAPPGPDSRTPPALPAEGARTIDAATHTRISIFFFFLFLFLPIVSILVYRLIYPPQTYTDTYKDTNASGSVYERGLVRADVSYKEILAVSNRIPLFRFLIFLFLFSEDDKMLVCLGLCCFLICFPRNPGKLQGFGK